MIKFNLRIYEEKYSNQFEKLWETILLHDESYSTTLGLVEIESQFYSLLGEGIKVSSSINDEMGFFEITLMGHSNFNTLLEYIQNNCEPCDRIEFVSSFSNVDFTEYIQLGRGDMYFEEEDVDEIKKILESYNADYQILRNNEIYERGASSYEETYLIALTAGLSVQLIMTILKKLKGRNVEKSDISSLRVDEEIKQKLIADYNLEPIEIYLAYFHVRNSDKHTELVYRTKSQRFYIELNKKGNIVTQKVTNYKTKS